MHALPPPALFRPASLLPVPPSSASFRGAHHRARARSRRCERQFRCASTSGVSVERVPPQPSGSVRSTPTSKAAFGQ
eukprot:1787683-Pleurochrysis_carterae.AAC.1